MLVQACVAPNADKEHCILAQYRTSKLQVELMKNHLKHYENREEFPVHWKIEVADQYNGWFPGVALHFNPITEMIHVRILNMNKKCNDYVYDGYVPVDHRIVRLVSCEDHYSHALFHYIIRNSVISIRWDLLWYRKESQEVASIIRSEDETAQIRYPLTALIRRQVTALSTAMGVPDNSAGEPTSMLLDEHWNEWFMYTARYYLPALNMLVIEIPVLNTSLPTPHSTMRRDIPTTYSRSTNTMIPRERERPPSSTTSSVTHYVVMKVDDQLLKLQFCHYLVGIDDFERLILEENIPCTSTARDQIRSYYRQSQHQSSQPILTQPRTSTTTAATISATTTTATTVLTRPSSHHTRYPTYSNIGSSNSNSSSLDTIEEDWSSLSLRCDSTDSTIASSRLNTSSSPVQSNAQSAEQRSTSRFHRRRHTANNLIPSSSLTSSSSSSADITKSQDGRKCCTPSSVETHGVLPPPPALCVICLEKPISNIAFIPCGHQIICQSCFDTSFAASLLVTTKKDRGNTTTTTATALPSTPVSTTARKAPLCPLCRSPIQTILKVFKG